MDQRDISLKKYNNTLHSQVVTYLAEIEMRLDFSVAGSQDLENIGFISFM